MNRGLAGDRLNCRQQIASKPSVRTFFKLIALAAVAFSLWVYWAVFLPVTPAGTKFVLLRPGWSARHIAADVTARRHHPQRPGVSCGAVRAG